jgi:tRNA-binding protein
MHVTFDPEAAPAPEISFDDFLKVDIRVGTVVDASAFPEAHTPSLKMTIEFGEGVGLKKSAAQIATLYNAQEIVGRQVMAVVNFPPRQIGPFMSEVLTLGFATKEGAITLGKLDFPVPNGTRLT